MSQDNSPGSDRDSGGNPNQLLAADPAVSAWVSANAGTGKTHVLINRISRLLLAGVEPARILCLTFTKAAAAEMANRLNKRLAGWAVAADAELSAELLKLTGSDAGPDDLAPARRLFAEVLDAPGGLNIRTIHSFCESLLGRFPLEAGVSPHFSVIDERTTAELLEQARDRLLYASQRPGGEQAVLDLKMLAGLVGEDAFASLKRELASKRGRLADMRSAAGDTDGLINAAYRALGLQPGDSSVDVLAAAAADGAFDAEALRAAATVLSTGTGTDQTRASGIGDWLYSDAPDRATDFRDDYANHFLTAAGEPRKKIITNTPAKASPAAAAALLAEQDRVHAVMQHLSAIADAEATAALLRFGTSLLDEFETLKSTHALLDYDDLILKTLRLLQSDSGVSWVHYKLDGGIDHVLVDEAQDTSSEQWQVISRIVDDFHSGYGTKEPCQRTIFGVGDEKQSIYSFQGADPEGFRRMGAYFGKNVADADCGWRELPLTVSYRSVLDVLDTVDAIFADPAAADGVGPAGEKMRHLPYRGGHAGVVEIWPTVALAKTPLDSAWDDPVDSIAANAPPLVLAERIAATIRRWLDDAEILASAGRPIREDDIMILVRKRGVFAEAMIRALKRNDIAVAGADRMILIDQLAVMDLVALGRFALLPDDDMTLAEVLKGPLFGFNDDALYHVAHGRAGTLWQALKKSADKDKASAAAVTLLSGILAQADYAPPFEFYARLLGAGGGRRAILGRLGNEASDPIDEFLELALDFQRNHTPSLQGFLHWIEAGDTQVKRDLEIDRAEVRVLTVHGSKGLQSNIVFLPDTCTVPSKAKESSILWGQNTLLWQPQKNENSAAVSGLRDAMRRRTEQEYRRLFYVAMTRARDRLYIAGWEGKNPRGDGCWYDLAWDAAQSMARFKPITLDGFDATGLGFVSEQKAVPEDSPSGKPATADAAVPPDWAACSPPPEPEPARPLVASGPGDAEPAVRSPFDGDDGGRFKRGTLTHRLLQSLPEIAPAKRRNAARRYLARPVHGLDPEQIDVIIAETLAVLDDPDFASLFGPVSLAEVPISGRMGGAIIAARLDRLCIEDDVVTVIDYKTNRPPPETADNVAPVYLKQMAAYRALLTALYPGRTIRCVLAWTDGPRLMVLPDGILDPYAP